MPQQQSLHATSTEACTPRIHAPQEKPLQWEVYSSQLEKAHLQQQIANTVQKLIKKKKKKGNTFHIDLQIKHTAIQVTADFLKKLQPNVKICMGIQGN